MSNKIRISCFTEYKSKKLNNLSFYCCRYGYNEYQLTLADYPYSSSLIINYYRGRDKGFERQRETDIASWTCIGCKKISSMSRILN